MHSTVKYSRNQTAQKQDLSWNSASKLKASMQIAQYVVVDTNEWIATKWFSTPVGRTFCDLISDTSMVLAIPEVLGAELEKHRTDMLSGLVSGARRALDDIERISGIDLVGAGNGVTRT